ncbi:DUF2384 domain-containing protein [Acidisoma cellulosilytica]|uniref:DUF2384 domain-containing protein n=1 Tax=Acidisoma cellulosilyticum TaxID=2802395 RepID=A0A963Z7L6_9PROT|nr:MbcA/ParS/Xre antitoxin family protein [Acidisoma cellulosilyticum]MCB8883347.1 DUF2384 domain-containing protein [Acidisoma cellulosilyticum]
MSENSGTDDDGGAEFTGSSLTTEQLGATVRAVLMLLSLWKLSGPEKDNLLGAFPEMLAAWEKGPVRELQPETLSWMANLLAIHHALRNLVIGTEIFLWVQKPNSAFDGQSALDVMLEDGMAGVVRVRRYLEAELHA